MIDKAIYRFNVRHELILLYCNGTIMILTSDSLDNLLVLYSYWLVPIGMSDKFDRYEQYTDALSNEIEVTRLVS